MTKFKIQYLNLLLFKLKESKKKETSLNDVSKVLVILLVPAVGIEPTLQKGTGF